MFIIKAINCQQEDLDMANFYCKCCGSKYSSISSLTGSHCSKSSSGRHVLYEGEEQSHYYCAYCGSKYSSLSSLTGSHCSKSPTGRHFPAR